MASIQVQGECQWHPPPPKPRDIFNWLLVRKVFVSSLRKLSSVPIHSWLLRPWPACRLTQVVGPAVPGLVLVGESGVEGGSAILLKFGLNVLSHLRVCGDDKINGHFIQDAGRRKGKHFKYIIPHLYVSDRSTHLYTVLHVLTHKRCAPTAASAEDYFLGIFRGAACGTFKMFLEIAAIFTEFSSHGAESPHQTRHTTCRLSQKAPHERGIMSENAWIQYVSKDIGRQLINILVCRACSSISSQHNPVSLSFSLIHDRLDQPRWLNAIAVKVNYSLR